MATPTTAIRTPETLVPPSERRAIARRGQAPEPTTLEETLRELESIAARRTGAVPAEVIARHVVAVTAGGDWPLRRAAMDAVLRRCRFGERDGLVVATAPSRSVFGRYTTARAPARPVPRRATADRDNSRATGPGPRPYTTVLTRLDPFSGSCDCPDFLRSSLGLCKHLLCVLNHVQRAEPARFSVPAPGDPTRATLAWDPVRPLRGPGERLAGLRWKGPLAVRSATAGRARAWFGGTPVDGALAPLPRRLSSLDSRARLVGDLLRAVSGSRASMDAEPAALALLHEERELLKRRLAGRASRDLLLSHLATLRRSLYSYQRDGVRRFFEEERLLLADDMGLGKTTQAVACCHALFHAGRVSRGLLVVPAALKPQWVREWEATSDVAIHSVDGHPKERARAYRAMQRGFLIVGYEQLLRDFDHVRRFDPQAVVIDEAQRIKNWETKTAAYVKALDARYRLALTGTPMENRLDELASLLDWIDDVALAPKWRLPVWHTYTRPNAAGSDSAGARNLDTLRSRLEPVLVRRVRAEVLDQLPPRTDTRISAPMTPEQQTEHDARIPPIAQLLARGRRRPLTQPEFLRLMSLLTEQRIISNGLAQLRFDEIWPACEGARPSAALLEGLFAPKLIELRRVLEEVLAQGRKVVVFSQWRRMIRLAAWAVGDVLGDAGLRSVFFTGAESPAKRAHSLVDFHDDPAAAVMFLTDAGGVGLNLQRAASCCINLELPWNPAVLEQRIGRIYRLGQSQPIDVYNLVTEQGIESRIATLVSTKKALFSGLFDGTTDEVRFEGGAPSFLQQVEKLVPESPAPPPVAPSDDGAGDDEDLPALEAKADVLETTIQAVDSPPIVADVDVPREDSPPAQPLPPSPAALSDVEALLAAVRVERTMDGGLRVDAPPEAAAALAALFTGVARLFARKQD